MKKHSSIILIFLILCIKSFSQNRYVLPVKVIDGDTIPFITLPQVEIIDKMPAKTKRWYKQNEKLMRNIKKVMPYAKMAAAKLVVVDQQMAAMETESERKAFYKSKEKELRDEFEKDIVKLNHSQGVLLLKLIDRETGKTTYSILRDYRSNVNAAFWQGFSRVFGYNLKEGYDPEKEQDIERVIKILGYD